MKMNVCMEGAAVLCLLISLCYVLKGRPCCSTDLQHEMKSVWCLWCVWRGFLFFRRWTAMHYWLENTPAMPFHLSSTADCELGLYLFIYLFYQIHFVLSARLVDWLHDFVGVMRSPSFCPLSHPPFPPTPSGRLNGSYAETTPSSPHPSAQYADRESHKTKDKGRQRHTNVEQWQGEIHSNGYNTDSVTSNGTYLTLCWALCCGRTHICVFTPRCLCFIHSIF